jgi:hypothetical protein
MNGISLLNEINKKMEIILAPILPYLQRIDRTLEIFYLGRGRKAINF